MPRASEEFGPDLDTAIPDTFDVCPECGTPTIKLGSHRCPNPETKKDPTREDLDRRVENDPYSDDETVIVLRSTGQKCYAYHESDADGTPLCPVTHDSDFTEFTREQAQRRQFAPCQFCQRIRQNSDEDDREVAEDE